MASSIFKSLSNLLLNPTVLTASDDMDALDIPGIYRAENTILPLHPPVADGYNASIIVLRARQTDIFQLWFTANKNYIYFRVNTSSEPGAWKQIGLTNVGG